jgi:hypothetical protein
MNPNFVSAGVLPVLITEMNTAAPTPNGATKMYLIHEALSRARMRLPQAGRSTTSTEATRSARDVAIQARRRAARELGAP